MNPFKIPQPIIDGVTKLNEIVETHPEFIPLPLVASLICMKADTLRNSIDRGQCRFGLGGQLGVNRAYKIPTVPFYFWYMQMIGIDIFRQ